MAARADAISFNFPRKVLSDNSVLHLMRVKRSSIIAGKLSVSCEVVFYYRLTIIVWLLTVSQVTLATPTEIKLCTKQC